MELEKMDAEAIAVWDSGDVITVNGVKIRMFRHRPWEGLFLANMLVLLKICPDIAKKIWAEIDIRLYNIDGNIIDYNDLIPRGQPPP